MSRNTQRGFSLPELLVALLIFSIIAAASVVVLRLSVDGRDQLSAVDREIAVMETARALIKDDLAQIALRPVRDEFGALAGPAFRDGYTGVASAAVEGEKKLLVFVRRGWSNPDWAAPRSSLQYVEYVSADNALIRRSRPLLDNARGQTAKERVLIGNIESVDIEFLAGEIAGRLEWTRSWPVAGASGAAPRALAMTMRSKHYGDLRQLFWIGDIDAVREAGYG